MKKILLNCKTLAGIKNIIIEDNIIVAMNNSNKISSPILKENYDQIFDLKNKLLLPGLIDPHVHVRDLDQFQKEDWISASKSAIAGGITSICDMPNTIPPTTSEKNLNLKRKSARKSLVNYKFHLGATENNLTELQTILSNRPQDVAGIKIFFAGSSSNQIVRNKNQIKKIFSLAKDFNKVVLVHSEWQNCLDRWQGKNIENDIFHHNIIRNRECAYEGTKYALEIAELIGNKIYFCHVSTAEEIALIKSHKNENVLCEITPHHLLLDEEVLELIGNFGKVNPPLRNQEDTESLWNGILDGTVDVIGSDHAPHKLEEKIADYTKSPSGFPGLETTFPLLFTEFVERNIALEKLVELISTNPALIFNFKKRGKLQVGNFADLIVINENSWKPIMATFFKSKAKYSPFDGRGVQGNIEKVFVGGKLFNNEK